MQNLVSFRLSAPRRVSLTTMVAILLAACDFIPQLAGAQVFTTVGVYDEPGQLNSVDFVASGSTLEFNQFQADVAAAFTNDMGGVNQCYVISSAYGPYPFSYGVSQSKLLNMTGPTNNQIGITSSDTLIKSISESGIWASTKPQMTFFLGDISSSAPNESVVKFGFTILSTSLFSLGNVTATATFSGGGKASANRFINEMAGSGDTFFGFTAPNGESISSVTFTNSAGRSMFFDDIGFITASIPPALTISRHGSSQTRVGWPTNAAGFSLEYSTGFPASAWFADTNTPVLNGDQFELILDANDGQRYYRLRSQ